MDLVFPGVDTAGRSRWSCRRGRSAAGCRRGSRMPCGGRPRSPGPGSEPLRRAARLPRGGSGRPSRSRSESAGQVGVGLAFAQGATQQGLAVRLRLAPAGGPLGTVAAQRVGEHGQRAGGHGHPGRVGQHLEAPGRTVCSQQSPVYQGPHLSVFMPHRAQCPAPTPARERRILWCRVPRAAPDQNGGGSASASYSSIAAIGLGGSGRAVATGAARPVSGGSGP